MCHADVAEPHESSPAVERNDHHVRLPSGEAIPVTEVRSVNHSGPAIVIGPDIFGRSPFHLAVAERLAAAGYLAIVPELFFRDEPVEELTSDVAYARLSGLDEPRAIDDLSEVIDWAKQRSAASAVGFLGFCLGGTFALALAARRADTITTCFYGFPGGHPPKTVDGGVNAPAPLRAAAEMHGPILGFWGADDARVGLPNVDALDDLLTAAGVDHDLTIVPGADHGFMSALLDSAATGHDVASRAWARTVAFFDAHLTTRAAARP